MVGSATSGQVVLGVSKSRLSKPESKASKQHLFVASVSAPASTFLSEVSALTSFDNRLLCGSVSNPFLPKLYLVMVFNTSIETKGSPQRGRNSVSRLTLDLSYSWTPCLI